MTTKEKAIMGDMFYFLRDHNNPPPVGAAESLPYWQKTAKEISDLVDARWNSHSLAMVLGMALYEYLEQKARTVGGDS